MLASWPLLRVGTVGVTVLLAAAGCKSGASHVQEDNLPSDPKCSILMPLLENLPNPGLPLLASAPFQLGAGIAGSFLQRDCPHNIKATLSTQSLDDIAALVGSEVGAALDADTVNKLAGLTRMMSQYVPESTEAREHVAVMKDTVSYLLNSFAKMQPPITYVYNYVSAATIEMKLLQEELRFNLEDAVDVKDETTALKIKAAAVQKNAASLDSAVEGYFVAGRNLRYNTLPQIAAGFFLPATGGIASNSFVVSGIGASQSFTHYTRCYNAKPLSKWEQSVVDNSTKAGVELSAVLKIRVDLLANPLCYRVASCEKENCQAGEQGYREKLDQMYKDRVDQLRKALDDSLFQTAEMTKFIEKAKVVQTNAREIADRVTAGKLFDGTKSTVVAAP